MALQMMGYTDVSFLAGGTAAWSPPFDLPGALDDFLARLPQDAVAVEVASLAAERPFLLDVRHPEEYAAGFIEGAVNVPLRELTQHLDALPGMDTPMLLVDSTGFRSAIGVAVLRMLGYENARSASGGMQAWTAAGLPAVTQPVPELAAGTAPQVNADLLAAVEAYLPKVQPQAWSVITPQALAELPAEARPLMVDMRQPEAYAEGHVEGSLNIPLRELVQRLDQIPVGQPVVLIDASGHHAVIGMTVLQLLGYENVKVLTEGLR